jgi:predicted glycosyltransferase
MCPDLIPASAVRCNPDRVLKYPGIKEDVYVPRFIPDPRIRHELGLTQEDLVVTVRPPATEAHYHNHESTTLFEAVMAVVEQRPDVKLVALPRNDRQAAWLQERWPDFFASGKMRIPGSVVDGLNLIWHSDLVVSGGGTMNREAAALGVPVYSVFRGAIGAVDRYLSTTDRLILLESVDDVRTKMRLERRNRPTAPQSRSDATLDSIVGHIAGIMDSRSHAAARQPAR